MSQDLPEISVVVPVLDEEDNVTPLYEKIRAACDSRGGSYEVIFVDDGSRDRTFEVLERIHDGDSRVRVLRLRKNYGQTAAMAAGFEAAAGRVVVSMDGDLQNDPADIPLLLAKMDEGYDVVCGWRIKRQDKLVSRRIPSIVANWIISRVTGVRIHDNGCSLKAFDAGVIKSTALYSELHRFIPAMSTLTGARIAEVPVNHHARRFGKSKYGLGRVWRVFLDIITVKMITGFSSRPSLWFGLLSLPPLILAGVSLFLGSAFFLGGDSERWLLVSTLAFLLVFLGVHLLSVGIVSELVVKTGERRPGSALALTARRIEVDRGAN